MKYKIIRDFQFIGISYKLKQKVSLMVIGACVGFSSTATAQVTATNATRFIPKGSIILNLGITPQTVDNGLKPYGLVYDLVINQKIPVIWSISPTKSKDGTDFSVDGIDFKGGAFIIEKQYAALPGVQNAINSSAYDTEVVKYTTLNAVTIPFYKELTGFTKWTFDTDNGSIADGYLKRANIPLTARQTALPGVLTGCHDLFVLPHADPEWTTHGRLYEWIQSKSTSNPNGNSGWLWSGCHAPNEKYGIENMYNPSNTGQRTNFLTTGNGTIESLGKQNPGGNGSAWVYAQPNDSPMQFIGTVGTELSSGSGPGYTPINGMAWRPSTKIGISDPSKNPVAYELVYGYAYGNSDNGVVMYEAGHDFDGSASTNVSAIRAFLNFLFDASSNKLPQFTEVISQPSDIVLSSGQTLAFNISASAYGNVGVVYEWTQNDLNGSFSGTNNSSTVYTAENLPAGVNEKKGIITISATDPCGRKNMFTYPITIKKATFCYKPANTSSSGITLDTKFGITALNKVAPINGNWPAIRKGAWMVLEAKSKGFVITRIADPETAIANPVDGMMVYDTTLNCLRVYVADSATTSNTGWKCFDKQTCPENQ